MEEQKLNTYYMYDLNVWAPYVDKGDDADVNYVDRIFYSDDILVHSEIPSRNVFPVTPENLRAAWTFNQYQAHLNLLHKNYSGGIGHDNRILVAYWRVVCKANADKDEELVKEYYKKALEHYAYYRDEIYK